MTLDEINGLASAIKIATDKGFWEQASFIAVVISAAISAVALWFIRAQMQGGNDQLTVLTEQVGAMRAANVTSTEQLKIFNQQLDALRTTNEAMHQQMVAAHDRAAKELTINLMLTWAQGLRFESRQVSSLVHKLDEEQCSRLDKLQEFYIDKDLVELAELCIPENLRPLPISDKGVLIKGKVLMHLRFTTVSYLNLIESILTAWHQNVIDRSVVEDQFAFLYHRGENALEKFRIIGDVDDYPSISQFLRKLKENVDARMPAPKDKSPLEAAIGSKG